jgi:predicted  nucleic acid-binding Zn-ribbon protein
MATPGEILRELHRLRRLARELNSKIEQGPRTLAAQQGRVARQDEVLHQAQENLKRLKVRIHEREGTLKSTLQQITKYEKQQNEAASKKEYDALQHEIDATKKKVGQIEDEILEAMGQSEEEAARIPEHEKSLAKVRAEVAQHEREQEARQASFAEQLEQTLKQVADVEATLPADVRQQYARLSAAKGEDALSAVNGRTCSACYTEITAQAYNDLSQGKIVLCKSCGRILYLPE